jgi:hypothetical protein
MSDLDAALTAETRLLATGNGNRLKAAGARRRR